MVQCGVVADLWYNVVLVQISGTYNVVLVVQLRFASRSNQSNSSSRRKRRRRSNQNARRWKTGRERRRWRRRRRGRCVGRR